MHLVVVVCAWPAWGQDGLKVMWDGETNADIRNELVSGVEVDPVSGGLAFRGTWPSVGEIEINPVAVFSGLGEDRTNWDSVRFRVRLKDTGDHTFMFEIRSWIEDTNSTVPIDPYLERGALDTSYQWCTIPFSAFSNQNLTLVTHFVMTPPNLDFSASFERFEFYIDDIQFLEADFVPEGPRELRQLRWIEVGETLTLTIPDPVDMTQPIEWFRDDEGLQKASGISGANTRTLVVEGIEEQDAGWYEADYSIDIFTEGRYLVDVKVFPANSIPASSPRTTILGVFLVVVLAIGCIRRIPPRLG